MKLHWFHLMPWPDLPGDLRARYPSVAMDGPTDLYDPVRAHGVYNEYLDELEEADRLGFDGICLNEHHQSAHATMASPNLIAAALARRTASAAIVLMGTSVPLYNPPTRLAEELAMLDVISGGRIVAGMPVGTPPDSVWAYGQNPVTLREKYREGVDLIRRAWTEPGPFAFNGRHTQLRYVNLWTRPLQQPHPPIWIPGVGNLDTYAWCVENGFLYAYLSWGGYVSAKRVMDRYWETVAELGAEPNPYRAAFLQVVALAGSDAEAERLYAPHARYFFNSLHFAPRWLTAPGYMPAAALPAGREADAPWSQLVESGAVVAGDAETVVQRLTELAETLRLGHLMLLLHFGDMPRDLALEGSARFARDVAPRLRGLHGGWQDDWFPARGAVA